jgi:hypothetical protein
MPWTQGQYNIPTATVASMATRAFSQRSLMVVFYVAVATAENPLSMDERLVAFNDNRHK